MKKMNRFLKWLLSIINYFSKEPYELTKVSERPKESIEPVKVPTKEEIYFAGLAKQKERINEIMTSDLVDVGDIEKRKISDKELRESARKLNEYRRLRDRIIGFNAPSEELLIDMDGEAYLDKKLFKKMERYDARVEAKKIKDELAKQKKKREEREERERVETNGIPNEVIEAMNRNPITPKGSITIKDILSGEAKQANIDAERVMKIINKVEQKKNK